VTHSAGHDIDPAFHRSPTDAISAPAENLAYVVAFDRAAQRPDALVVLVADPASPRCGQIAGWTDLPTSGNETTKGRFRILNRPVTVACSEGLKLPTF
jgi:selenium-binding protein 1